MVQTKQQHKETLDRASEQDSPAPAAERDNPPFDLTAYLRANPEIIWNDLREQIAGLIEALIDARLQLEGPDGATRQEIALDLYDEELITKREAIEIGGFDRGDFFERLFARRRTRRTQQSEE